MQRPMPTALCLALLTLVMASCNSTFIKRSEGVPSSLRPHEVPAAITSAEEALLDNKPQLALDWMRIASELDGLPSNQRLAVQRLLEISADRFVSGIQDGPNSAETLAEVLDLDLPRQIAVTAAIKGAEMYLERQEYQEAVKLIQRVDKRFPSHHLRPEAGRILMSSGLALSELNSTWFDSYRDYAFAALEYVSVNYPTTQGGDRALRRLGEMYAEDGRWEYAIARHEELTQNYPNSSLVASSLASIPHLRLESIESPEYDRKAIIEARIDLQRWLEDYSGHEDTEQVRLDLRDALVRLAESDLVIASFYRTVKNDYGLRYHAERALVEAKLAGDDSRVGRAQNFLNNLGPLPVKP